jgi:hypothetical protein
VEQIGWRTSVSVLHGVKTGPSCEFDDAVLGTAEYASVLKAMKSEMVFGVAIDLGPGKFRRSTVCQTARCLCDQCDHRLEDLCWLE